MKRRQSGVALVLVLWVITLLSVIAGNFAFSMRGEAKIARNLISTAQAQALAATACAPRVVSSPSSARGICRCC